MLVKPQLQTIRFSASQHLIALPLSPPHTHTTELAAYVLSLSLSATDKLPDFIKKTLICQNGSEQVEERSLKAVGLIPPFCFFRFKEGKVGFFNVIRMGIAWMLMVSVRKHE